jgi:hypothetical protein
MENKGLGMLVMIAVALIVGLILFQAVAANVSQSTGSNGATSVVNASYTAILNTNVEITGQELVSVGGVVNITTGVAIPAANYTVSECVRTSDNLKGICLKTTGTAFNAPIGQVAVSYTYYPVGYIDDAGGRAIAGIIVLLLAVALAVIVLGAVKYE